MPNHVFLVAMMPNHDSTIYLICNVRKIKCYKQYRIGKHARKACRIHDAEWVASRIPSDAEHADPFAGYDATPLCLMT